MPVKQHIWLWAAANHFVHCTRATSLHHSRVIGRASHTSTLLYLQLPNKDYDCFRGDEIQQPTTDLNYVGWLDW
jgi:hypothetical protein